MERTTLCARVHASFVHERGKRVVRRNRPPGMYSAPPGRAAGCVDHSSISTRRPSHRAGTAATISLPVRPRPRRDRQRLPRFW